MSVVRGINGVGGWEGRISVDRMLIQFQSDVRYKTVSQLVIAFRILSTLILLNTLVQSLKFQLAEVQTSCC